MTTQTETRSEAAGSMRPQDVKKTPFYKKPSLPWSIITAAVIAVAFYAYGWHNSQAHTAQVKADAQEMVTSLSKEQK